MTDIDTLLRETLNDDCWALPVPDGVLTAVEGGVRRRRRRALSFAAVATATAAVATVGILVVPSGQAPTRPVTPPSAATTVPVPGGGQVSALLATAGSLYVLADREVLRLDRTTHRLLARSGIVTGGDGGSFLIAGHGATVWVSYTSFAGQTTLQGLDPMVLSPKATIKATEEDFFVTANALWSTSKSRLLRRDPDTGAVTRTVTCACQAGIVAADEAADVAWSWSGADSWASTTVEAIKLSTGELRGRRVLPAGYPTFVPGSDGTLWAATGTRRLVQLSPDGAREVATAGSRWVGTPDVERPRGTYPSSRDWRYDGLGGRLSCRKPGTGEVLATYPVMRDKNLPLTGDDHELFTLRDDRVVILRGPDRCLS